MAEPYCGPAVAPGNLWAAWNLDPFLLTGLALLGAALWHRRTGISGWVAVLALIAAFVSPLCAATVSLFSARALHHLILAGIAAPALALSLPIGRRIPAQIAAMGLAAAMLAWHLPGVYAAVWQSQPLYWAMQAAIVLPAWMLWSAVIAGRRHDSALGDSLLILSLAGLMGMLGAVLTFAPGVLYPQHIDGAALWGIGALQDQRLAGLILWLPGFLPMAGLAAMLLRRSWQDGFAE